MRINITIEQSTDFAISVDRTKTELEPNGEIWLAQHKNLRGTSDLVRWVIDNNDFNQYCRFGITEEKWLQRESEYAKMMRWINNQNLQHHPYMQYLIIPVFNGENLVEFIGLFCRCSLQHHRKKLTCYRFGPATIQGIDGDNKESIKEEIVSSLSVNSSKFMQRHCRLCSKGVRPIKVVKSPEKSIDLLTNYSRFDTMRVPKGTLKI